MKLRGLALVLVMAVVSGASCSDKGSGQQGVGHRAQCDRDEECASFNMTCHPLLGCVACQDQSECPDGQACEGGLCKLGTGCERDSDCGGDVCDTDAGFCAECVSDVDCSRSRACALGICVAPDEEGTGGSTSTSEGGEGNDPQGGTGGANVAGSTTGGNSASGGSGGNQNAGSDPGGNAGTGGNAGNGGTAGSTGEGGNAGTVAGGGMSGSAGTAGSGGSGPVGCGKRIDDFEDTDNYLCVGTGLNGKWFAWTNGGTINPTGDPVYPQLLAEPRDTSTYAMRFLASNTTNAGIGCSLAVFNTTAVNFDATAYTGIEFYARATAAHGVSVQLSTEGTDPIANGGTCASNCATNAYNVTFPTAWQKIQIQFSAFQGGNVTVNRAQLRGLQFATGGSFELWIDDLAFY